MLLTIKSYTSILKKHSQKTSDGIGVPKTNGVSHIFVVFLCAKSQFHIIMLDWVEQSKDWMDSFVPLRQFYLVRLHNWRYVVGFKTLQTEAVMPKNYAQEPSKIKKPTSNVSLTSLFSLFDSKRKPIATGLTFGQVKPISEHIAGSVIKFERMIEVLL